MTGRDLTTKPPVDIASFAEVTSMAKAFVQSGMFQDTKQLSQAIVKIMAGMELGLPAVYSMQNINLIRNRLTSSANTMAMLVKRSGRYNYRIKEHTDKVCTITFYEKDGEKWLEVGESTFSMDDAKRADLIKPDSGWMKYPRAMLFSRAISQGARIYAPDAIGGIYTDEEIRSIPPRPNDDIDVDEETGEIPPEPAGEVKEHWCTEHNCAFVKKGNMKAYAHIIKGTSPVQWHNEPKKEVVAEPPKEPAVPPQTAGQGLEASTQVAQEFTTAELFARVAEAKGFTSEKTVRPFLVKSCGIAEKRIDTEPAQVWEEIKGIL